MLGPLFTILVVGAYGSSGFQIQKKTLNIPYKQMAFLQSEFSYVPSDFELEKKTVNIVTNFFWIQAN